jgi:hypothetical protein
MKYRYSLGHNAGVLYRAGGLSTSTPNPTRRTSQVDEQKIVDAVIKALEQTEVWRWAKSQIQEAEAGDGFDGMDGEEFDSGYTDEFPEDQDDDQDYVEDDGLGDGAAFADDGEEPVRYDEDRLQPLDGHYSPRGPRQLRRRYFRDGDLDCDGCDPEYAAAARGREAYRPAMIRGGLRKFPRRGDRADATWFSGDGTSPATAVKTIEMPAWTRSSASPFVERREDGSFSMSEAVRHATADPKQEAAVRRAAAEQERRYLERKLEAIS